MAPEQKQKIHPTAIIGKKVEIGRSVLVGPYAILEDDVNVGDGTTIAAHVYLGKNTQIGKKNQIDVGVAIGGLPQKRGSTRDNTGFVSIGDNNIFREYVTIHRASAPQAHTRVGNNNFFMAAAHVAHDCFVGDFITLANSVMLGGHVTLEDSCFLGGGSGVHQFCRIGRYAMIGGGATITKDVPPYMLVDDNETLIGSMNIIGFRRGNFSESAKRDIKNAYKWLYRSGLNFPNALKKISENCHTKEAMLLLEFAKKSQRGLLGHRK